MRYNFHTHSCFDDGQEPLDKYVEEAVNKGLKALGFSAHAPLNDAAGWCLIEEETDSYINQVKSLKEKFKKEIDIYLGMEVDYVPDLTDDFLAIKNKYKLEYIIGSVHLVKSPGTEKLWFIDGPEEGYIKGVNKIFGGDYKKAVEAFYIQSVEMVASQKPDIIGHLDKVKMHNKNRFFSEDDKWYNDLIDQLLEAISISNTIVEVNTRGKYRGRIDEFFPSEKILHKCYKKEIPVMVNTDAHKPEQVDMLYDEAVLLLKDIGFKKINTPFFSVDI